MDSGSDVEFSSVVSPVVKERVMNRRQATKPIKYNLTDEEDGNVSSDGEAILHDNDAVKENNGPAVVSNIMSSGESDADDRQPPSRHETSEDMFDSLVGRKKDDDDEPEPVVKKPTQKRKKKATDTQSDSDENGLATTKAIVKKKKKDDSGGSSDGNKKQKSKRKATKLSSDDDDDDVVFDLPRTTKTVATTKSRNNKKKKNDSDDDSDVDFVDDTSAPKSVPARSGRAAKPSKYVFDSDDD